MMNHDYVVLKLHQQREEEFRKMNGIQRAVAEIVTDYKDQMRRKLTIRKPRK